MEEVRLREQEVGAGSGWQQGTGGEDTRWGVAGPPLTMLSLQELSKREVVAVGHLEVPAELAGLLQVVAGTSVLQVWWVGTDGQGNQAPHAFFLAQALGQPRCPR